MASSSFFDDFETCSIRGKNFDRYAAMFALFNSIFKNSKLPRNCKQMICLRLSSNELNDQDVMQESALTVDNQTSSYKMFHT